MIEASIRAKKTTKAKGGEWVKLMIRLNWDGQRAAFGSGLVIPAEDWDADAGWIRSMRGRSDKAIELNNQRAHLRKEKEKREQQWQDLKRVMPTFSAAQLKAYVAGEFDPVNKTKEKFETWVKRHIETFDQNLLPGKSYKGAVNTKKKYEGSLKYLLKFAQETGEPLTWANMDHEFVAKLKAWRVSKPARYITNPDSTDPVSHNTVAKLVKDVRGWITRARKQGVHDFRHTDHPEWSISASEPLRFALSQQQLAEFFEHPLPDGPWKQDGIRRIRDLFCVQCCVGQRISDLQKVVDQFNQNPEAEFIQVVAQKTKTMVSIPVFPLMRDVAKRCGGKLPDVGAHQKYNTLLKKAAKKSGLFEAKVMKGENMVHSWELMTSHVARRTFATIAISQGVPTKVVMAITGHKSEAVFNKYLVHNDDDILEAFKAAGFGGFGTP